MKPEDPTLAFVCGSSDRSTLACALHGGLNHDWTLVYDVQEVGEDFLFVLIDRHLEMGRSILATATLSKPHGQDKLRALQKKYPKSHVRIIWCVPNGGYLDPLVLPHLVLDGVKVEDGVALALNYIMS